MPNHHRLSTATGNSNDPITDMTCLSRAPRRARISSRATRSRSSNSSSTSTSSSSQSDVLKASDSLNSINYSPTSEALSLTDLDEFEYPYEDGEDAEGGVPEDLDEVWDFSPKPGDAVWVKEKSTERETWYLGHVQKSTKTGVVRGGKQGTFYSVRYHGKMRKFFAPLLGDIKPDTPHVRRLMEEAGCDIEL